jgi:type IV secretory pathway VirB9-like protein
VKKIWFSFAAFTVLSWPASGQKVEVQKPDRGQILHVQTALNHLTVLEMTEPVSTVAVGSPVFKVEWRENKVFIQPTEPNVATNLFVWTASGRFNYELDPAGSVPQMDFASSQVIRRQRKY